MRRTCVRTLGPVIAALMLVACSDDAPRPTLADLPMGAPPRIGYVGHQVYVEPGGRRTPLPRRLGVSGIVPYAGGFLVSDTLFFEGTVGLNVVRDGRVVGTYC